MIEINDLLKNQEEINGMGSWRPAKPTVQSFVLRLYDVWKVLMGDAIAVYWKEWK